MTVQPTEQWVQTLFRICTGAPGAGGGPASALRTRAKGTVPSAAKLPAVSPERLKNVRRLRPPSDCEAGITARGFRRPARPPLLITLPHPLPTAPPPVT